MSDSQIIRDARNTTTSSSVDNKIPVINTSTANPQPRGKIAFDKTDENLYLSDGLQWNLVGGGTYVEITNVDLQADQTGIADGGVIIFDNIVIDDFAMYNTVTGLFTVTKSGTYRINAQVGLKSFSSTGAIIGTTINVPGHPQVATIYIAAAGLVSVVNSVMANLVKGDTFNITLYSPTIATATASTYVLAAGSANPTFVSVVRL